MRQRLGPRLYLRKRRGCAPTWVIRDDAGIMTGTGYTEQEKSFAEAALFEYVRSRNVTEVVADHDNPFQHDPCVYFVSCEALGFPIKIGWTTNISSRLAAMQNAMPYKAVVLGTEPGDRLIEVMVHHKFRSHRLRGEWFARAPELMSYIEGLQTPPR